uniref:Uncharacterized protein n=1 Tax=Candidatus Kentrum sp. DK TaxID=2126562 RepID=A0A450TDU9_9GAMM|nr:MAG: hypothetical protein BECKDK2373B_GA0170837_114510 [Candidatus Kentron sp. DK]
MQAILYQASPNRDRDHMDQHVLLHGIGWDDYEAVPAMQRQERPSTAAPKSPGLWLRYAG